MEQKTSPKFGIGDKVRVINFGHLIWESIKKPTQFPDIKVVQETEDFRYLDFSPHLIGKEGLIETKMSNQGVHQYSIKGIPGKQAWYSEQQLELVTKNPNNEDDNSESNSGLEESVRESNNHNDSGNA